VAAIPSGLSLSLIIIIIIIIMVFLAGHFVTGLVERNLA
jgi:hypothetical protein